ncbi:MAG TPA: NYN domain-containing protein [Smithellaceae bacterium]|nr:NYN domain-containing protein [Smithellaceae bacterium]
MDIIIDGYNLIRQSDYLRRFERQSLEAGRLNLINQLSRYQRIKGHKITVVFDGWESGGVSEERDRQGGIDIIYSRRGEKADDVIKRIAGNSSGELIVVSSDREIVSFVTRRSKTALSSPEFELIMMKAGASTDFFPPGKKIGEEDMRPAGKKGPSRRLPKAARRLRTKITKL